MLSTLSLTANRPASGLVHANALLRSPLPVWAALFTNVLAFSGLPTILPIPPSVGQMITQGALILAFLLALMANPRGIIQAEPLPFAAFGASCCRPRSEHPQPVHAGFNISREPPHRLCYRPLATDTMVGKVGPRPAPLPYLVLTRRRRQRADRCRTCAGRRLLLRGPPLRHSVAHSGDAGSPLRGCPARLHCRAVVRWPGTPSHRLVHPCRGGSSPSGHSYPDRASRHGCWLGGGWREHVSGSRESSAYVGGAGRGGRDRYDLFSHHSSSLG